MLVTPASRVTPFIVTLGTMSILRGAAKGLAHEQKIDAPQSWLERAAGAAARRDGVDGLPAGVWLLVVLALAAGRCCGYTRLGRHVFAIGSNEQAARLCGVRGGAGQDRRLHAGRGCFAGHRRAHAVLAR